MRSQLQKKISWKRGEKIVQIMQITVYVNSEPDLLIEQFEKECKEYIRTVEDVISI